MLNLKNKIKNYGFWVSLTSAIVLVLQTVGKYCGFSVNSVAIESIVASVCGVFVVLGIISNPESGNGFLDKKTNTMQSDINSQKSNDNSKLNSNK